VARAEPYLHAKFQLDPSNHLATVHERYRQDRQTDNGRPKIPDGGGRHLEKLKNRHISATADEV